jgi:hypothetical protein
MVQQGWQVVSSSSGYARREKESYPSTKVLLELRRSEGGADVAIAWHKSAQKHVQDSDPLRSRRNFFAQPAVRDEPRQFHATPNGRSLIALFLLSLGIFFLSPISDVRSDPQYSILVSESILKYRTPALNQIRIPGLVQTQLPSHPNLRVMRPFYELVRINDRVLYAYPHGSSLLSLPLVALINAIGISATDPKGNYYYSGELWTQKLISSFLMAIVVCIFFQTSRLLLPRSYSLIIALGAGFGSQIWSTATRALWSHTWEVFLTACLVLILLKREEESRQINGPLLATLVSWMYFVRPTGAIVVVAISVLIFFCFRDRFFGYAATGLVWLCGFMTYSWIYFGRLAPDYYGMSSALPLIGWPVAFAGCLISPSRGLLIFVPSVLSVLYLIARYWRTLPNRRLVWLSVGIIGGQLVMVSTWPVWWGGWSYGPRLLTDLIPWFVLLGVLGSRAYLDCSAQTPSADHQPAGTKWAVPIALSLIAIGIFINGYGAVSIQTRLWNAHPNIDKHQERLWDWAHPQFIAGWVNPEERKSN